MEQKNWQTVTKNQPCSNCGKDSWCSRSIDGDEICRRSSIPGGKELEDKNGQRYWLKINAGTLYKNGSKKKEVLPSQIISDETCHQVNSLILQNTEIDDNYLSFLSKRKLTIDEAISLDIRGCIPKKTQKLIKQIQKEISGEELARVPGFYLKNEEIFLCTYPPHVLIPIKTYNMKIKRLLLRLIKPRDGNKYLFLSSASKGGNSSGSCVHFARPTGNHKEEIIYITEGPLKATIVAHKTGHVCLGLPGVASIELGLKALEEFAIPPKLVRIAFDNDFKTNEIVKQALINIFEQLEKKFPIEIITFPEEFKGFDDALMADALIKTLSGEEAKSFINSIKKSQNRPIVLYRKEQFATEVLKVWSAIAETNREDIPYIYQQNGKLIMLEVHDRCIQTIIPSRTKLKSELARKIIFKFESRDRTYDMEPLHSILEDMIVTPDASLPTLELISPMPLLSSTRELLFENLYYPDHKVIINYIGSRINGNIKHPTLDNIVEATELIKDLIADFPFDSEADFANAISLFFLPPMRLYINGCLPLYAVDATTPGTGKGLLTNVFSIFATGSCFYARSLPDDDSEIRKWLTSELQKTPDLIVADNISDNKKKKSYLDSPSLAAVLTSRFWSDRLLGQSKIIRSPNNAIWIVTGNNIALSSELERRTTRIRLTTNEEDPSLTTKKFRHTNLLQYTKDNRGKIIGAILTIINAWRDAGMPYSNIRLGSFENYSAVIGGILEFIGVNGFLQNRKLAHDDESNAIKELVKIWAQKHPQKKMRANEVFKLCYDSDLQLELRISPYSACSTQHLAELASILKKYEGRVFAGHRIKSKRGKDANEYFLESVPTNTSP